VLPALGHLPAGLGKRQRKEARFAERGEECERGGGDQDGPRPDETAHEPQRGAERCRGDDGREGEEREGEAVTGAAPTHGGSEGLDHGEASGRPGARDSGEERRRRESGCDG
jgi:hypothetical protein